MTDNVPMYFLVQNGSVVFGPRRYYKPAFVRFAQVNELEAEFPDTISELMINVGDKLVLVHESKLNEQIYEKSTSDTEVEIAAVIEAALESDESVVTKNTAKKRK